MTDKRATLHLARAKAYLAKGEGFYRKAAEEIVAAMAEDTTLGYGRVAYAIGKSESWCRDIVSWSTNPQDLQTPTPYAVGRDRSEAGATRKVLANADPEQIAEFLSDPTIRAKVSKAQDIAYSKVEQKSRQAQRKAIGERASDDLDRDQQFRNAEAELFKARRGLIETVRLLNTVGVENLPDSWREEFLRTFDDITAKVDIGRSLLVGSLDEELEKLLGI